jgi:hypothetical protein
MKRNETSLRFLARLLSILTLVVVFSAPGAGGLSAKTSSADTPEALRTAEINVAGTTEEVEALADKQPKGSDPKDCAPEPKYQVAKEDQIVTDMLGTRQVKKGDNIVAPLPGGEPPVTARNVCGNPYWTPTWFTAYLGPGWSELACRWEPCQSAGVATVFGPTQGFQVDAETEYGQFICRGQSYGYGSSVWYHVVDGCWVWSGGTDRPRWNRSC